MAVHANCVLLLFALRERRADCCVQRSKSNVGVGGSGAGAGDLQLNSKAAAAARDASPPPSATQKAIKSIATAIAMHCAQTLDLNCAVQAVAASSTEMAQLLAHHLCC